MSCILWERSTSRDGYGKQWVLINGKKRCVGAHRVAFFQAHGYWPNVCRHTCDVKLCINPEHLLDGTHADNRQDAIDRGRIRPRGPGRNLNMPDQRLDKAAYDAERRRRKEEGTWNYQERLR